MAPGLASKFEINADMGEGFGRWKMGPDEELMPYIDAANIACGFHAGDPSIMHKTIALCKQHGVKAGAHPGLADLLGFGRRKMEIDPKDMYCMVLYQVGALKAMLDAQGVPLAHIKPHGELFFYMQRDLTIMRAVLEACATFKVPVYGAWNTAQAEMCAELGVEFQGEVRPDRQPVLSEFKGSMAPKRVSTRDFTVGWVCALPVELAAAEGIMDEQFAEIPSPSTDNNIYSYGRIKDHNVVIVCLPAGHMGTNSAATAASLMKSKFPCLRFGLLVGIGSGVPNLDDDIDIRLGDVVISQPEGQHGGVIQYDFGKNGANGRIARIGSLNAPPQILLGALSKLCANDFLNKTQIHVHLSKISRHSHNGIVRQRIAMLHPTIGVKRWTRIWKSPHFLIPFGRNENFVGRETILSKLLERIPPTANGDACPRTAIVGLEGIGKTQVAIEAAYRVREVHPDCSVFWVPAVSVEMFDNHYRKIGRALKLRNIEGPKADVKTLVRTALERDDINSWLLIVDNADDTGLLFNGPKLAAYIPSRRRGSILFTSRNSIMAARFDGVRALNLSEMNAQEAARLLHTGLSESQIDNGQSTTQLLEKLTYLPLALKQASAYLKANIYTSISQYLEYCEASDEEQIKLLG
ncbi:hypothetical protein COL922a_006603 [Colletotrichum nupharicola]|nr:hypothetical protein COL922a_006603 [Colletotrichum nupharicola]